MNTIDVGFFSMYNPFHWFPFGTTLFMFVCLLQPMIDETNQQILNLLKTHFSYFKNDIVPTEFEINDLFFLLSPESFHILFRADFWIVDFVKFCILKTGNQHAIAMLTSCPINWSPLIDAWMSLRTLQLFFVFVWLLDNCYWQIFIIDEWVPCLTFIKPTKFMERLIRKANFEFAFSTEISTQSHQLIILHGVHPAKITIVMQKHLN